MREVESLDRDAGNVGVRLVPRVSGLPMNLEGGHGQ